MAPRVKVTLGILFFILMVNCCNSQNALFPGGDFTGGLRSLSENARQTSKPIVYVVQALLKVINTGLHAARDSLSQSDQTITEMVTQFIATVGTLVEDLIDLVVDVPNSGFSVFLNFLPPTSDARRRLQQTEKKHSDCVKFSSKTYVSTAIKQIGDCPVKQINDITVELQKLLESVMKIVEDIAFRLNQLEEVSDDELLSAIQDSIQSEVEMMRKEMEQVELILMVILDADPDAMMCLIDVARNFLMGLMQGGVKYVMCQMGLKFLAGFISI